jgi:hypothetical protein
MNGSRAKENTMANDENNMENYTGNNMENYTGNNISNNMANYTGNNAGNNSRSKSIKLFEETENSDIRREPSRFTPVTVDRNPPPLSEQESEDQYLSKKQQLGGGNYRSFWDHLHRK